MILNLQIVLIFGLDLSLLVTDELLTRIGLELGCKESNMLFNYLNKKKGKNWAHGLITLLGFSVLFGMFTLFQDSLLLSLFAFGFAVPVVINARA
jgi:hypothetical protein